MDLTELSLAPRECVMSKTRSSNSSSESELSKSSRKRKLFSVNFQTSVDLQLKDPLPWDWEQCLDLESGRMYYVNKKSLRRSWSYPKEKKLDLELNISTNPNFTGQQKLVVEDDNQQNSSTGSGSNMVALPCMNCHLLVILFKSYPSCPNCKYVHALSPPPQTQTRTPNFISH
ncbi:uncharacterized protein LOC110824995 [Carica papaya]|uniref:uncharacterized protein LOC110824995 n=1 Tax=Carica papaya TaxID=3649 RepID=UPI000B8C7D32|nr:uncharacterized protein LOC110824995 [Carica papaya]